MSDDLGAIDEDVPFDWDGADKLATAFDDMADEIDGQIETRTGYVEHALTDGEGAWATLFLERATVGMNDAYELVPALKDAAEDVRAMKRAAEEEQERREAAREWKQAHDEWENDRNALEKGWDWVTGDNGDLPPKPDPPTEEPNLEPEQPEVDTREWSGVENAPSDNEDGIFAARPTNMDDCAEDCGTLDSDLSDKYDTLLTSCSSFLDKNGWGTIACSQLVLNSESWIDANKKDNEFLTTAAEAFRQADQSGAELCYANAIDIYNALNDAELWTGRTDIKVQWSAATGGETTTGYTNDPVSTASGNFYEPEVDLTFGPLLRPLQLRRTYNSLDTSVGPFGTGWASWASARLKLAAAGTMAHLKTPDGAEVTIPVLEGSAPGFEGQIEGDGDGGLVARFPTEGASWQFDPEGRPVVLDYGPGQQLQLRWDGEQLVRMEHERGRWFGFVWDDRGERIVAAVADDGRRVTYRYNDQDRLVGVDGPATARRYEVDGKGLILSVTDGDGVVLARNTYDTERRVVAQETPFGRRVRFWYRDGLVTEVDDDSGGPLNTWVHDERGHLTKVVDGHGNRLTKAYDRRGNVIRVTDRRGATTHYHWDDEGNCRRIEHPDGRTVELDWDVRRRCIAAVGPNDTTVRMRYEGDDRIPTIIEDAEGGVTRQEIVGGLLKRAVDPDGVVVEFEHDAEGRVIAITDGTGATRRCEWNDMGLLTATVTPLGHRTEYRCDAAGRLIEWRDPNGAVTTLERSPAGRVTAVISPDGARRELRRGDHGELTQEVDPLGGLTSYQWDQHGSVAGKVMPDGGKWNFQRDALNQVVSATDPSGATWLREHDAEGTLVGTISPMGARRSVSVDELGVIKKVDDGLASVRFEYDQTGRPIARRNADGTEARCTYDRCGRMTSITEATGGVTRFEYSPGGRLVAMVGPTGARTTYSYDKAGRLCEVGQAAGGNQRVRYDADGRIVRVVGPCGETTRYSYDPCDRPLTVTTPHGGVTRYTYDLCGRVETITDPDGGVVRYCYDALGQVETVTDPNGGVVRYQRDAMGRVTAEIDPLGGRSTFTYDEMGRPLEVTDPLGRTTHHRYNADGRLVHRLDPDGTRLWWDWGEADQLAAWGAQSPGRPAIEVRLQRDLLGRISRIERDGQVAIEAHWDADGNLIVEVTPSARMRWERDGTGKVVTATLARPGQEAKTVTCERDLAGQPIVIDDPDLGRYTITRDAAGRPARLRGPGLQEERTWDEGLLISSTRTVGEQVAATTRFDHDAAGRVVQQQDSEGARTTYSYDAAGQLTGVERPDGTWRFDWDPAGRLAREDTPSGTNHYRYDAAHQLQEAVTPQGTTGLDWDPNGRRLSETGPEGTRQYRWDSFGRLEALIATSPDGTSTSRTLAHDPLGRLSRVGDTPILWDTTRPYSRPWAIGDHRVATAGSTLLALVDGTGAPTSPDSGTGPLDPWGASVVPTGMGAGGAGAGAPGPAGSPPDGPLLGYDGELSLDGLSLLGHRVYDPRSRSFLSTDPLPGIVGHPWTTNPYHYAGNDPIGRADPLGLKPVSREELDGIRESWNDNVFQRYEGYFVAAGLLAVGIGLQFVPGVGTVVGGAIIGAAIGGAFSAASQQAINGDVNYGQVAVDMAIGAVGGGAGAYASVATSGMRTAAQYGIRAGVDIGINTVGGMTSRGLAGEDPFDPSGIALDVAVGGVSSTGGTAFDNWLAARRATGSTGGDVDLAVTGADTPPTGTDVPASANVPTGSTDTPTPPPAAPPSTMEPPGGTPSSVADDTASPPTTTTSHGTPDPEPTPTADNPATPTGTEEPTPTAAEEPTPTGTEGSPDDGSSTPGSTADDIADAVDDAADRADDVTGVADDVADDAAANADNAGDDVADDAGDATGAAAPEAHTTPSGTPDPDASPSGRPARLPLDDQGNHVDDADTVHGKLGENAAADTLARHGYDIEQNPTVPGNRDPDYLIEGEIFDAYTPKPNTSVRNIWSTVVEKVIEKQQTQRVVINMTHSNKTMEALEQQFRDWPIEGLEEIIVVRGDEVIHFFPFS